jgi:hypothetical protein
VCFKLIDHLISQRLHLALQDLNLNHLVVLLVVNVQWSIFASH